jgi:hypothetical protein
MTVTSRVQDSLLIVVVIGYCAFAELQAAFGEALRDPALAGNGRSRGRAIIRTPSFSRGRRQGNEMPGAVVRIAPHTAEYVREARRVRHAKAEKHLPLSRRRGSRMDHAGILAVDDQRDVRCLLSNGLAALGSSLPSNVAWGTVR